jgi:hypothetical protein
LLNRGPSYLIAETADLQSWKFLRLPELDGRPKCLEYDGASYFVGLSDGTILRSENDEPPREK